MPTGKHHRSLLLTACHRESIGSYVLLLEVEAIDPEEIEQIYHSFELMGSKHYFFKKVSLR